MRKTTNKLKKLRLEKSSLFCYNDNRGVHMKNEYTISYNESDKSLSLVGDKDNIKFDDITFGSDDNITINISPFEVPNEDDEFYIKFISLLNKVTNLGCKVNINVVAGADINFSIKNNDVIGNIMALRKNIKNKDNIELSYIPLGQKMPFTEYEQIEEMFDLAAKDIEEKNFSPLEKAIAAYKIAIGIFSDDALIDSEKYSYDKYSSIYGSPNYTPMCQSYTQIFEALCKRLKIKYESKSIIARGQHAIDVIDINDEQYGINGRYFVDITLSKLFVAYLKSINQIGDDKLPVCQIAFGIGENDMNTWATAYNNEIDRDEITFLKLSDTSIPKATIEIAQDVVNNSFVQHLPHK